MTISDILARLTDVDGGAFLFVSWFVSWALEGSAGWKGLSKVQKQAIILGASALLGVGAAVLGNYPAAIAAIEPYAQPVIYVIGAWLATQTAHRLNVLRSK